VKSDILVTFWFVLLNQAQTIPGQHAARLLSQARRLFGMNLKRFSGRFGRFAACGAWQLLC